MITKEEKKDFNIISNYRNKNEKASWMRKKKQLEALVSELNPLDEKLLEIQRKKLKIIDEITAIRVDMVVDCIHPKDYLIHYDKFVVCKFCERKIFLNKP